MNTMKKAIIALLVLCTIFYGLAQKEQSAQDYSNKSASTQEEENLEEDWQLPETEEETTDFVTFSDTEEVEELKIVRAYDLLGNELDPEGYYSGVIIFEFSDGSKHRVFSSY